MSDGEDYVIEWQKIADMYCIVQGGPKKDVTLLLSISSPIIDRFFSILSLAHSADNLQQCDYRIKGVRQIQYK